MGYIDVSIPKEISNNLENFRVYIDNVFANYSCFPNENSWFLHFMHQQNVHNVIISLDSASEFNQAFSTLNIMICGVILAIISIIAIFLIRRRRRE